MRFSRFSAARLAAGLIVVLVAGGFFLAGGSGLQAQSTGSTVTYQPGWNLVALPPGTVLTGADGPLYTYQAGDTNYETVQQGQATTSAYGYWAYFTTATTETLAAGSNAAATVTAPAGQYIMVGNPSGSQSASVSGADIVYGFDTAANNYAVTTTLAPGQGAWVYSASGGTITITPSTSSSTTTANQPPSGAQPPAARFYGAVTVSGQPATSGIAITATAADGATCGTTTAGAAPATGSSNYALDITGSDSGCTTPGSTISFNVGGTAATPSTSATIPDVSGAVHVDLSS